MTQFSFDPTPPVQGKELTIHWAGQTPCTINIEWTPPGEPKEVFLVKGQVGATVMVPANAETVIVSALGEELGAVVSAS